MRLAVTLSKARREPFTKTTTAPPLEDKTVTLASTVIPKAAKRLDSLGSVAILVIIISVFTGAKNIGIGFSFNAYNDTLVVP